MYLWKSPNYAETFRISGKSLKESKKMESGLRWRKEGYYGRDSKGAGF